MDFLEDLFDMGRRNRRKGHGDHDEHYHDDDHDNHYDNQRPINRGYEVRGNSALAKQCSTCHGGIADTFKFCPHCGTPVSLAAKCGSCGAEIVSPSKFCSSCGTQVCHQ